MNRPARCLPTVVAAVAFAIAAVAGAVRGQDEAAWDKGYAAVRASMQKGKWPEARTALTALLAANQGKLWAIADRQAIVEDHRLCAFWCQQKVPKPQEILSGKVESWDAASGQIRVHYDAGTMSDWHEVDADVYVHPMVFSGPYTLTIKDHGYPEDGVRVRFDFGEEGYHVASFGGPKAKVGVVRQKGKKKTVVEEKDAGPAKADAPFTAQLRVGADTVELLLDGKSLLKCKRGPATEPHVGLDQGHYDDILLEGRVEPAWFQSAVDDWLADQRERFNGDYQPEKELPAWLFGELKVEHAPVKHTFEGDHARSARGREFLDLLNKGEFKEATALAGEITDADVDPKVRGYVVALAWQRYGEPEKAVPAIAAARKLAPEATYARVLEAEVLVDLRRPAEALPLLQKAWTDDPGSAEALNALFVATMRGGDVAGAVRLVRNAKCRFGLWEEAYDLDRTLAMQRRGPAWPRHFVQTSAHYEVHSDIDAKVCALACSVLEESYASLAVQFAPVPEEKGKEVPRFQVWLFSGESSYQEYNSAIIGHPVSHTAGLYSPVLKQLLIWNVPKREEMLKTVRHEGFHQYLDRVMLEPPRWFNEGMAEYWENAVVESGRLRAGQVHPEHLATMQEHKKDLPKLRQFVYGSPGDFYANAQLRYAQGWALVHFLRESTPENKKLFQALWDGFRGEGSNKIVLDKVFQGLDWDRFETDWKAWIEALRARK